MVVHEIRCHLIGKADRIACGHCIHHPHLVVLSQKQSPDSNFVPKCLQRHLFWRNTLISTYRCYVHDILHKSSCQLRAIPAKAFLMKPNSKNPSVSLLPQSMEICHLNVSYICCVWIVLLCHQSLVVSDVLKCLTGKAAKREIKVLYKISNDNTQITRMTWPFSDSHPSHPWLLKPWAQSTSCCSDWTSIEI